MSTKILISPELQSVLDRHNITRYAPAYGGESVGLDLYYTGTEPIRWYELDGYEVRKPIQRLRLIPTGLKIALDNDKVGLLLERGSISKTSLVKRAGVIDPGYTGEIFVNLVNLGGSGTLMPGDKLPVQLVVVPCDRYFDSVTPEEFAAITSTAQRSEGKVGSSN